MEMEDGKGEDGVEETGGKGVGGREGAEKALLSVLSKKEKGTRETDGGGLRCEREPRTRTTRTNKDKEEQEARRWQQSSSTKKSAPSTQSYSIYIYQHTVNHVTSKPYSPLHLPLSLFPSYSRSKKKDLPGSLYAERRMPRCT